MSDLISRQAAIDAILKKPAWHNSDGSYYHSSDIKDALDALPSAQPEVIRCKDCKWKNRHNCTRAVEVFIDDDKYCSWAERKDNG